MEESSDVSQPSSRHSFRIGSELFLRCLAVVYAMAFASLWVQIDGLVSSGGVLPAKDYLEFLRERLGKEAFSRVPTLCWLSASDGFLHFLCGAGVVIALVAVVTPLWNLYWILLWAAYLSLCGIGQIFLAYQWDIFLLEVGFLAIFLAPLRPRFLLRSPWRPPLMIHWAYRWLLFRFMIASGVVKWLADETWRNLTALNYHFETQPLPPWTAWYVHQLPEWFHKTSTGLMFAIELLVPFFLFLPALCRRAAALLLIAFQCMILLTGNYGFFNILSLVLCLPFLDDGMWPARLRRIWTTDANNHSSRPRGVFEWTARSLRSAVSVVVILLGVLCLVHAFERDRTHWVPPFTWLDALLHPVEGVVQSFHLVNPYGLFANMTETRPEIVLEGSEDGSEWKVYEFKYKPTNMGRRPGFVAPHMPRLDWQMWFAALRGNPRWSSWFLYFCHRILAGEPKVLRLLGENPFPDSPPRFLRATLWEYHFSGFEERSRSGHWWRREQIGPYLPPVTRESLERALGKR